MYFKKVMIDDKGREYKEGMKISFDYRGKRKVTTIRELNYGSFTSVLGTIYFYHDMSNVELYTEHECQYCCRCR